MLFHAINRNALLESYLPPLTLQPPVRFSQALVAKKMASTVKLTKNLPLTRRSPMSHYLSAKGSTAWEISVKERKEVVEDDVPVGWRIVEKAPTTPTGDASKDKKSGGLFSFWGRRQSQAPTGPNTTPEGTRRSTSVDKPKSPVVTEVKAESRRPSQDSVRSSMAGSRTGASSPAIESVTSPGTRATPTTATPPASLYASTPDPLATRSDTPPAPSAVSRFLNRFSRRGSVGGSAHSSLALSTDDLEFLSDIVPSASDDVEDDSADALEKFVNAKKEPAVPVLPPPLAPPPLAPPLAPPLRPFSAASRSSTVSGAKATSPTGAINDLDSLFGSFDSGSTPSPGNVARPAFPVLAPPMVPSRPITPASTPGAGPSNAPVTTALGHLSSSRPPSRAQISPPPLTGLVLPPPPSFKAIAPSVMANKAAKPKLSFPLPPASIPKEEGPLSGSSTASTSYETAGEASPSSPTSSLPLGQLYPHLVTRPTSPPQASGQALMAGSGLPASFGLETPLASAFPTTSNSTLLRPPTHPQSAVSPTAVPLSSNLFDDDDFSDFQSPVERKPQISPPAPPPIEKSPRILKNASSSLPFAGVTAPLPPASSLTLPPPHAVSRASIIAQPAFSAFDSDDFADFQDSPIAASATVNQSSSSSLFATSTSDKALLTPQNSSGFGGLDDFFGGRPTLATPSPPRVPAKPAAPSMRAEPPALAPPPLRPPPSQSPAPRAQPSKLPPPPAQTHAPAPMASTSTSMPSLPSSSSTSSASSASLLAKRRKSHAAEHLHTLNLMERAAARSGKQWPAPPSPLPAAIPGPDGGFGLGSGLHVPPASGWNFMDDVEEEEGPSPVAVNSAAPLAPSFSSPAMMPPQARPGGGLGGGGGLGVVIGATGGLGGVAKAAGKVEADASSSLLQGWGDLSPQTSTPVTSSLFATPAKPANGMKGGGLSAQDLSFFEGL